MQNRSKLLTDNAPLYERPFEAWKPRHKAETLQPQTVDLREAVSSVEGTTRRWIYQQYDQRVGGRTVRDCDDSVSVVKLLDSGRGLGLVLGCRPYVMRMDARLGGYDAAFYPALELASKGFQPLAMTDCLNFGNPEKPHIMSEFVASVEALAHAAQVLDAPVISGNVSFYNETNNQNITSTPATGLVGLRENVSHIPHSHFTREGDTVFLLRSSQVAFTGDQLARRSEFTGELDAQSTAKFVDQVRLLGNNPEVHSTRVVGKFGLGYALFKMCSQLGCDVKKGTWAKTASPWSTEHMYEVLVAGDSSLEATLRKSGAEVFVLGRVGGNELIIDGVKQNLESIRESFAKGWGSAFEQLA